MFSMISPKDALQMLESGQAILIDVRESDEFKDEHIAYALSIPLSGLEENFKKLKLPSTIPLIISCLKGGRGNTACAYIEQLGSYKNPLYNMEGGITAWKENSFPVVTD